MSTVNIKLGNSIISNVDTIKVPNADNVLLMYDFKYGAVIPSGTKTITENGTYDVTNFASADVNVSGGSGQRLSTPNASINKSTKLLSWPNVSNAIKYIVYKGTSVFKDNATSPVSVTTSGSYQVKAFSDGEDYLNSAKSTAQVINFYNVVLTGTNTKIDGAATKTYELVADTSGQVTKVCAITSNAGYKLPDSITVSNVGYTYTKTSDTAASLTLHDPTAAATVSIVGVEITGEYDASKDGTKLTINSAPASKSSSTLTIT